MTRRAIGATSDVVRAAADPAILEAVPDGATPVLLPADDPDLAAAAIGQGLAYSPKLGQFQVPLCLRWRTP